MSWESVAEGFLSRANLILEYSGAPLLNEACVIELRRDDDVFEWQRENNGCNAVCQHAERVRRFIASDVS
eukprot:COSAG06_NODE_10777_length_1618_cov_1.065833_1_plen_69_part_10